MKYNAKYFYPLIALLCAACIAAMFIIKAMSMDNTEVKIISDGKVYLELDLNDYCGTETFSVPSPLGGENIIEIKDGKISVIEATCPDKLCVHQGQRGIGCNNSAPIVCLPNKLSIYVDGKSDIDAVSGIK